MISRIRGTLISRDLDRVEIETSGGVVYEIEVPLSILERIPMPPSEGFELRTLQIVREDSVTLYGFAEPNERELFRRLLFANGVGPKLALAMLSTFSAPRLAQALVEKDITALRQVSGVGAKKAEKIALDLADKVQDLAMGPDGVGAPAAAPGAQEAVAALVALGFSFADADTAVRKALEEGDPENSDQLIRRALASK
jgi:holliday junction DNA helicase RuvA